jgi:chromosome segregation protein
MQIATSTSLYFESAMTFPKGLHPGTIWRRSDLQCHSPRDVAWNGPPNLPGGTPEAEQGRKDWATSFIEECRTRAIEVISITDHHDVTFVPYLIEANQAAHDFAIVFPGIEVTCNDNAQCLVLFEPSSTPDLWGHFLGKLPGVAQADRDLPKTSPTINAQISISGLLDAMESDSLLRDSCIILPHFSDGDAHKHLNEDGHHDRFAALGCEGVYIEKPYQQLASLTIDKAYGRIPEWGKRRRAFIATGDNRVHTWDRLGAHECWIKLGESSVEAIRQALLADESRISYVTPEIPSERILELHVVSALTGEERFDISFNDGFTTIIGGRGSGKSALLEYLRFGLGRTRRDLPRNEGAASSDTDREERLIEETLAEVGYVEVKIEREGVIETWYRDLENRQTIWVTSEDEDETELTIEDAQRRFRARAFYQKGLSTTMNNAVNAAEQITGIAAAEQLDERRKIDADVDRAKRAIGVALRHQSAFWQTQLEHRRAVATVSDLKRRIDAIAGKLKKEGVQQDALDTIAMAQVHERAKAYHAQVNLSRTHSIERIQEVQKAILTASIADHPAIESFPEIAALDQALSRTKDRVDQRLSEAITELREFGDQYVSSLTDFESRDAAYQVQLKAATAAQQAHKQLLDEHARLLNELKEAEAAVHQWVETLNSQGEATEEFTKAVSELDRLVTRRAAVLTLAARRVEEHSSQMLKAKHKSDPQPKEYIGALEKLLSGARVHDAHDKCVERIGDMTKHDAPVTWGDFRRALLDIYKAKIAAGSGPDPSTELANRLRALIFTTTSLTQQQVQKIYQNLSDDPLSDVFAAVPDDYIALTYIDHGRDIEFQKASPGQQASALLELLLRQSAGTLIIDQPEDDLDNRVIMQIVNRIRTSKSQRQLRHAIAHIMEGGKEAFDLRGRKYRFDRQENAP